MLHSYISNYKYSSISSLEKYLTNQIIEDHKNGLIEIKRDDIEAKDLDIDIEAFQSSNQILSIRNLSLLIDVFTSNKSSAQPMTFFYDDMNYIVFFSKVSNMFPFVLIRMKESKKIQCKNSNSVYDFPISDIFKKEIVNRKRFDIILDNVGYLKYDVIGYDDNNIEVRNEIKISNGRSKNLINDIIGMSTLTVPFQTYLMNMYICILKQETHKDKIIIFDNDIAISKTYLIVDNNDMIIEIEKCSSKSSKYISPTTLPLVKSSTFTQGKFLFEPYRQTFRLPYQKLINVKTKINYCLVHTGDDYYFLKVLAKSEEIKPAEKLCDIFNLMDVIIEGYKLKQV